MKTILAAFLFLVLPLLPARAAEGERWDARITAAMGEVTVHPADGSEAVSAEDGMPLEQGDRVATGADSSADISFDGGSMVSLRPDSDFTLERTETDSSSFLLALGSLIAKIEKLGSRQMRVRTPTLVAAVRGTEFGVEVEDQEQAHVAVFDEGQVEVRSESGGTELLEPQQETSVRRGQPPLKAFALRRLLVQRRILQRTRARLRDVRKRWKTLSPEKRQELRHKVVERMRERRQQNQRKREDTRQKREQVRTQRRQDMQRNNEKMERRREQSRRKPGNNP